MYKMLLGHVRFDMQITYKFAVLQWQKLYVIFTNDTVDRKEKKL